MYTFEALIFITKTEQELKQFSQLRTKMNQRFLEARTTSAERQGRCSLVDFVTALNCFQTM